MLENLSLCILNKLFGICRLDQTEEIPNWVTRKAWYSITRTEDEISIVCEEKIIPSEVKYEGGWRSLKILGPLDFGLIGVLAGISKVLAENGISIFVISTYDTDYILIKDTQFDRAIDVLRGNGCRILG